MKTASGLYFGNVSSSLAELLRQSYEHLPTFRSALVRCLDSDRRPDVILSVFVRFGIEASLQPAGIVLASEQLYSAARREGVFAGFDEVWLFENEPPEKEFPLRLRLTSDAINVNQRFPDMLEPCMKEFKCVLALGDGCGLNYVTWDRVFAAFIEGDRSDWGTP